MPKQLDLAATASPLVHSIPDSHPYIQHNQPRRHTGLFITELSTLILRQINIYQPNNWDNPRHFFQLAMRFSVNTSHHAADMSPAATFRPELLSPAGTLKAMRFAFAYGADAVYAGMPRYSLRVRNNEFDLPTLAIGIARTTQNWTPYWRISGPSSRWRLMPLLCQTLGLSFCCNNIFQPWSCIYRCRLIP